MSSVVPPKPCVIVIDPSTGLGTFVESSKRAGVELVVVATESSGRYPAYFESADCDGTVFHWPRQEVPSNLRNLSEHLDVRSICAGDESALDLAERSARLLRLEANDPDTTEIRRQKTLMSTTLRDRGLQVPRELSFHLFDSECSELLRGIEEIGFPVILKPNESAGSVCTLRCLRREDLPGVLARAREEYRAHSLSAISQEMIAQKLLEGREWLVDSYSLDGRHYCSGIFSYRKLIRDGVPIYQSVEYHGLTAEARSVQEYVWRVLDELGNRHGLVNTDLFATQDGPTLLEVNCRIVGFGGWLSKLERLLFGANQADMVMASAQGSRPESFRHRGLFGELILLQSGENRPMRAPNEAALRALPSYHAHGWNRAEGELLRRAQRFLHDTVGAVLLAGRNLEQVREDAANVIAMQNTGRLF